MIRKFIQKDIPVISDLIKSYLNISTDYHAYNEEKTIEALNTVAKEKIIFMWLLTMKIFP